MQLPWFFARGVRAPAIERPRRDVERPRPAALRARPEAKAPTRRGRPANSMVWHILPGCIIDPVDRRRFRLVTRGLDRAEATEAAANCRVVLGHFPLSKEATGNQEQITEALQTVSASGDHRTSFASLYRDKQFSVLFVDPIY